MANWDILKRAISTVIKTNGNQEITGQVLQNVLTNLISSVGENATFAGVATPATSPGNYDGPVFYLASQQGTYSNFDGIVLQPGQTCAFVWSNGQWHGIPLGFTTKMYIDDTMNTFKQDMQEQFGTLESEIREIMAEAQEAVRQVIELLETQFEEFKADVSKEISGLREEIQESEVVLSEEEYENLEDKKENVKYYVYEEE